VSEHNGFNNSWFADQIERVKIEGSMINTGTAPFFWGLYIVSMCRLAPVDSSH
jgi:hypothetical protein